MPQRLGGFAGPIWAGMVPRAWPARVLVSPTLGKGGVGTPQAPGLPQEAMCSLCVGCARLPVTSSALGPSCPHPALPQFSRGWGWNKGPGLAEFQQQWQGVASH